MQNPHCNCTVDVKFKNQTQVKMMKSKLEAFLCVLYFG